MTRRYQERAILFGRERTLVGVSCRPRESSPKKPAIIFVNAGIVHRIGANRTYVMLARALAAEGFGSLRFDLAGVGDSLILPDSPPMTQQERTAVDIDDALSQAASQLDTDRFIIAGLCSGADNALRTMGRDERVVGSILLDLNAHRTRGYYLRYYGRRLLRAETWRNVLTGQHRLIRGLRSKVDVPTPSDAPSPSMMLPDTVLPLDMMREHLERIVERNGKLLAVFTAGLPARYNYATQFLDMFPGLDFGPCLRLEYFADSDHSFSRQRHQERLKRLVLDWVETVA